MSGSGLGWTGSAADVKANYAEQTTLASGGNLGKLVDHLGDLLLGGSMSTSLRQTIIEGVAGVSGSDSTSHNNRVRAAVLLVLASPDYAVQR